MWKKQILAIGIAGLLGVVFITSAQSSLPTTNTADATTKKIVAAANAFVATLSDAQKSKVIFAWGSDQRSKWSNFPTGIFQRSGLKLGDMNTAQKNATFALLQVALSERGYKQIRQVIDGDQVLKTTDGGGGNLIFGEAEYYISFVGTPSETTPWTLQFGGHHMALNITVFGKDVVLTPSLTGGQPTSYTLNGVKVQPIVGEVSKAFTLINSLSADQQKKAIIGSRFIDLVLGPGKDGVTPPAEGLPASSLTAAQQTALLSLIEERIGILNDDDTKIKMDEIKANLSKTYFAWAGPTTAGSAAYFRISGPTLWLEYSPQSMGGDANNHVHSMLRDPTNDYGKAKVR